jgi:hypothetical protein
VALEDSRPGGFVFRRLVSAAAAGVAAVAVLVAAPLPAHADGDLSVTWPAVTAVNPEVSDYVITVSDTGPGDLVARWSWQSQPIPHNGQATLTLPGDGNGEVEIWRCESGTCVDTRVGSPFIEVHRAIAYDDPIVLVRHARNPGAWEIEAGKGFPGLTGLTYDWTLRTEGDEVVGTGSVADDGGETFDVPAPAGLNEGAHLLDIDVRGTFAGAPIQSASTQTVQVDVDLTAPPITIGDFARPWLLPYDKHWDEFWIYASTNEWASFEVNVMNGDATVLGPASAAYQTEYDGSVNAFWDGRIGEVVMPPGEYFFEVIAMDEAGNVSVAWSPLFLLDHARERMVTRSVMRRAADVVTAERAGRCSALSQPSSHGWAGSLGLHSQVWCDATAKDADVVEVEHELRLPVVGRGVGRRWLGLSGSWVRLEALGAPARGDRSGSEMLMALVDHDGRTGQRTRCGGELAWCSTGNLTRSPARWISRTGGENVLRWMSTVSGGSRYDVKAYRLTIRTLAYVEPDGSIFWPR